jgi:hypothetical protein
MIQPMKRQAYSVQESNSDPKEVVCQSFCSGLLRTGRTEVDGKNHDLSDILQSVLVSSLSTVQLLFKLSAPDLLFI